MIAESNKLKADSEKSSIKTQAELAKLMGRHRSQVNRWLDREDWPFSRSGPWLRSDLSKMLRWAADALDRGKEPDDEEPGSLAGLKRQKLEQEIRKLRISADNADMRNQRERASVIDRHLIEPALMKLAEMLRRTGDTLTRKFGNQASEILNQCVDDFEQGLTKLFEELSGSDNMPADAGADDAAFVADTSAET